MNHKELEVLALRGLVGAAVVSPTDAAARLDASLICDTDFADTQCRAIFGAVAESVRSGKAPEVVSLLRTVGNRAPRDLAVGVLTGYELGVADVRLAAVREASQRRQMLLALESLQALVRGGATLDEATSEAQRVLGAFAGGPATMRSGDALVMDFIAQLDAVQNADRDPITPTGIEALDLAIGGLQPTLTVIGSLPAVGKSALLATLVSNLAHAGTKVGVLSLEDSADFLTRRLTAAASGVPVPVLAFRRLSKWQREAAAEAVERLYEPMRNVVVEDRHGLTTDEVVAAARRMVALGCRAVLVDHLGEIRIKRTERHDLDITEVLQALRGLAKTYRIPIVVACHLKRREGLDAKTEPRLTDFAFSAGVERMARVALGLWRCDDNLAVTVLKQTQGIAGITVKLNVNRNAAVVAPTPPNEELRRDLEAIWGTPS